MLQERIIVAEFWKPSIDPLQELYNHAECLGDHQLKISEIASVVNHQTEAIQKLARENHMLLRRIQGLEAIIRERLQAEQHASTYTKNLKK